MSRAPLRTLLHVAWLRHSSHWWRFAASLARNRADAEDLVDEAIVRTLRADPSLANEAEVHAYVITAIRNTWFKWAHVRARRKATLSELWNQRHEFASVALRDVVEAERHRRLAGAVSRALERMPPENKAAIRLYLLEDPGLRLREIADVQGVSVTTAHERVQKALRVLADELKEFD